MASWLSKGCQDHAMVSSTNGGGKTVYPHIRLRLDPYIEPFTKKKKILKMDQWSKYKS